MQHESVLNELDETAFCCSLEYKTVSILWTSKTNVCCCAHILYPRVFFLM